MDDEIESILHIAREVMVYKIPPLTTNAGHRAGDWGELNTSYIWKGRLRIIETSQGASLVFEDSQTGELFAKTPYDPDRPSVEAVLDSSRYFVVRIEDSGKKAYIGMGFVERTDSFDFNVALQDYSKRYRAAQNPVADAESEDAQAPAGLKKDYTLKEGQTFSINIPGRNKSLETSHIFDSTSTTAGAITGSGSAFPLLPPPPTAPRRR